MDSSTAGTPTDFSVDALMRELCAEACEGKDRLLDALDHHLASGGSRSRAKTCLACSEALDIPTEEAVALGTAVECLHNASLVQDDLQDRSPLRRGQPSIWKFFDEHTALCLTDLLLSAAYAALARINRPEQAPRLIRQVHRAVSKTLRGQMQDTSTPSDSDDRLDECLKVATSKSVPFFSLGLELPLIVSGNDQYLKIAARAAKYFGMGYQTYDDLEDLEQDEREGNTHNIVLSFGKPGPGSAPIQHAVSMANDHLETARTFASLLPNHCGDDLIRQALILEKRMKEMA